MKHIALNVLYCPHVFVLPTCFVYLLCYYSQHDKHCGTLDKLRAALASCEQRDVKSRQVSNSTHTGVLSTHSHVHMCSLQDLKNAKTGLKKTVKALEKDKEKMEELTAAPERLQKEIASAEKKLKILEVTLCINTICKQDV